MKRRVTLEKHVYFVLPGHTISENSVMDITRRLEITQAVRTLMIRFLHVGGPRG